MASFGEALKEYRQRHGMSQSQLAKYMGCSKQAVSYYENEQRDPKISQAFEWAKKLGITFEPLTSKKILPGEIVAAEDLTMHTIPLIGSVAAGEPILANETHGVAVSGPLKADFALIVQGDSMTPQFIEGDTIYIRAQPDVEDGQIAVVLIDDSATLKHVYHTPEGLSLISNNPKYAPINVNCKEHEYVRILGIVVGFTRILQ